MNTPIVLSTTQSDVISTLMNRLAGNLHFPRTTTPDVIDAQTRHRLAWNGPGGIREQAMIAGVITPEESELLAWALANFPQLLPPACRAVNQLMSLFFEWRRRGGLAALSVQRPHLRLRQGRRLPRQPRRRRAWGSCW